MATTWALAWAQIQNRADLYDDRRADWTDNFLAQEATDLAALVLEPANAATSTAALKAFHDALEAASRQAGPLIDGVVKELGLIIKAPEADSTAILARVNRYMIDNPDALSPAPRLRSRQFVRGAFASGSPWVGNGTFYRLFVDQDGFPIENSFADVITLRCTKDRQGGAPVGQEVFEVRGRARADALDNYLAGKGSGGLGSLALTSADDTASLLGNPSFADGGDSAAPTSIPSWTVGTIGNFEVVSGASNVYRKANLESTARALKIKATDTVTQKLSTRGTSGLDLTRPYYLQIAWNRQVGAATGTLLLRLGSKSVSVTVAAQTGWQVLKIPIDKNLWPANFNEDDLDIVIDWTRTAGDLLVDDVVFAPFKQISGLDNMWMIGLGGTTRALLNDTGTFSDIEAGAKIQRVLHRGYGISLPAVPPAPGAPTVALAGAGAGNVDNGTHSYKITFRRSISDNDYSESGAGTASAQVNVVDKTVNGKVALSAIPTGATGTYSRRIWRTVAGDTGDYKLVAEITDNTTTVYTDNTADAGLGASAPTGITIDDL